MTIKTRVIHLIRQVNHLRLHLLKPGRYNLGVESGNKLILRKPKEFEKPNQIVAHGLIDIEKYLLKELPNSKKENKYFKY